MNLDNSTTNNSEKPRRRSHRPRGSRGGASRRARRAAAAAKSQQPKINATAAQEASAKDRTKNKPLELDARNDNNEVGCSKSVNTPSRKSGFTSKTYTFSHRTVEQQRYPASCSNEPITMNDKNCEGRGDMEYLPPLPKVYASGIDCNYTTTPHNSDDTSTTTNNTSLYSHNLLPPFNAPSYPPVVMNESIPSLQSSSYSCSDEDDRSPQGKSRSSATFENNYISSTAIAEQRGIYYTNNSATSHTSYYHYESDPQPSLVTAEQPSSSYFVLSQQQKQHTLLPPLNMVHSSNHDYLNSAVTAASTTSLPPPEPLPVNDNRTQLRVLPYDNSYATVPSKSPSSSSSFTEKRGRKADVTRLMVQSDPERIKKQREMPEGSLFDVSPRTFLMGGMRRGGTGGKVFPMW